MNEESAPTQQPPTNSATPVAPGAAAGTNQSQSTATVRPPPLPDVSQGLGCGLLLGVIAALVGVGMWGVLVALTESVVPFMSIFVGLVVGFGVAFGAGGAGRDAALGAAVITGLASMIAKVLFYITLNPPRGYVKAPFLQTFSFGEVLALLLGCLAAAFIASAVDSQLQ